MINTQERLMLAKALQNYLNGDIDSLKMDDIVIESEKSQDNMVSELAKEIWYIYDDCSKHTYEGKHRLSSNLELVLNRWIELLNSKVEWNWDTTRSRWSNSKRFIRGHFKGPRFYENEFFPFSSQEEWQHFTDQTKLLRTKFSSQPFPN